MTQPRAAKTPAPPPMQMQFEADQPYQTAAIAAVADLFDGQMMREPSLDFLPGGGFALVANHWDLTDEALLAGVRAVQMANGLPADDALGMIERTIPGGADRPVRFPNFSIEMETGTGKTYVYIRTALTLARRYGWRKFIIVVPSVAIREGVLKTFQVTRAHFATLFGNLPYRFSVYSADSLARLRQFADNDQVEFLIMTIASFDRDANVIRRDDRDSMPGIAPLALVQAVRPIVILDEPQNLKSDLRETAIASLHPLFALRYSATHPKDKLFNRVYRLTPYDAYRQRLVKRIEVAGVQQIGGTTPAFMRLESVATAKKTLTARITLHVLEAGGTIREKTVTFKANIDGTPLSSVTTLPDYADYTIADMSITYQWVTFTNGETLSVGETRGADKLALFDAQIRTTIEEHFRKQRILRSRGIKALTLFFIDQVASYTDEQGVIRRLFREAFDAIKVRYPEWADVDAEAVQAGYFAVSKGGDTERDKAAYDLIMRDKETLLTFSAPDDDPATRAKRSVCFLFSHSALREGWDNPNVFQICTLNQSISEMRKRQEIGRGVRLPVDQSGARVRDERLNVLTVIANQSYESYVATLQSEVAAELGSESGTAAPAPEDARQRDTARLNPAIFHLSEDFRALWDKIRHKTRYELVVDRETLLTDLVIALNNTPISPPHIEVSRSVVSVNEADRFEAMATGLARRTSLSGASQGANLVDLLIAVLRTTTPPIALTRQTAAAAIVQLSADRRREALANPNEFAAAAARIVRAALTRQLESGLRYYRIDAAYELSQFTETIESWRDYLVPAQKSVYDQVVVESGVERAFVEALEGKYSRIVRAYVKLPRWFTVPTPIGTYNPDWAIVVQRGEDDPERVYFVSETKGTAMIDQLRPDEQVRVIAGERHFVGALGVPFYVNTSLDAILRALP